ncbi:MAG: hypothetical protein A3C07_03670 [Candidatus Sungbacteria bacterium RIFCSPHIGHO2_02_FULL_47_11]|uniref:Polymerase nucleotidyl transferase domain-containing protein n=1 Tax=Candidatus Sungbacteria bacterium RIFCSPHIGHO2_02_FULL_47_11 TaxID=1802270 RepID=A0A1G2KLC6_9BACT|nr:MAG: hypothetical protein A3C07_03670 [Candidatus Sungbacteria bacterium RIFCSPHIGHO2_02_FULL_47_11]
MKKPVKLIVSQYRKDMWREMVPNLKKMLKHLPVEEVYVIGSFSSKKQRPADIDFMVLFKTKEKQNNEKWSFDFVVAPNNKHGKFVLDDVERWMRQKYGKKNFEITRIL